MPVTIVQKPKAKKNKHNDSRIPWPEIKQQFIETNLEGRMTLTQVAEANNIVVGTLANKAAADRWYDELREKKLEITREVEKAMAVDTKKVITQLKAKNLNDELAVRQRHLGLSRKALLIAKARLDTLDSKKMTVRETLDLLKFGVEQERRALGMVDETTLILQDAPNSNVELSYGKVDSVIGTLIDLMKGDDGVYEEVKQGN